MPNLHLRRIHTIFSNGTNLLPKDNLVTDYNTIKNNHSFTVDYMVVFDFRKELEVKYENYARLLQSSEAK